MTVVMAVHVSSHANFAAYERHVQRYGFAILSEQIGRYVTIPTRNKKWRAHSKKFGERIFSKLYAESHPWQLTCKAVA